MDDNDLRDKITQLRRERDAHLWDESEYTDAVMALIQADREKAVREARIEEKIHARVLVYSLETFGMVMDQLKEEIAELQGKGGTDAILS